MGPSPGRGVRAFLFLLIILGFLIYSPSLRGGWVYDDNPAIVAKHAEGDLGGWAGRALTGRRTLTDFTFALNRAAGGLDPLGYHLVNVLLHACNAWLVFLLAAIVLRRLRAEEARLEPAAQAAALLFLFHPLLSQAVAYTAQRYTSLATFFYLLCLLLYVKGREKGSIPIGAVALICAFLSMRCKEISFTLPLAVLLVEASLFRRRERKLLATVPFLLLLPLIPIGLLFGEEGSSHYITTETLRSLRETPGISRAEYFAVQLTVLPRYLFLLAWPSGLTIDRDVALLPGPLHPAAIFSLALLVAIGIGAVLLRRKCPVLLAGYIWFLLTASVESSIVPIRDLMVEHRVYLPSVGLFLAAGSLLARIPRGTPPILLFLLIPLALGTFSRARVWSGPVSLWEDAAKKAPAKARPWVNLGLAYRNQGRFGEAVSAYEQALSINWLIIEAVYGLGLSREGLGEEEEALRQYARGRSIAPDYGPLYDAEATLLDRLGERGRAIELLRRGIENAGEERERWSLLGDLLLEGEEAEEAEAAYRRALGLDPRFDPALVGIARSLVSQGRAGEAEALLRPVASREGASAHLWNSLGVVRLALGDRHGAQEAFRKALRVDPGLHEARRNLERLAR